MWRCVSGPFEGGHPPHPQVFQAVRSSLILLLSSKGTAQNRAGTQEAASLPMTQETQLPQTQRKARLLDFFPQCSAETASFGTELQREGLWDAPEEGNR